MYTTSIILYTTIIIIVWRKLNSNNIKNKQINKLLSSAKFNGDAKWLKLHLLKQGFPMGIYII